MPNSGRQVPLGVVVVGPAVDVGAGVAAVVDVVKPDLGLVTGAGAPVDLVPSSAGVVDITAAVSKGEVGYSCGVNDVDVGPPGKVDDARVVVSGLGTGPSMEGSCTGFKGGRAVLDTGYTEGTSLSGGVVADVVPP